MLLGQKKTERIKNDNKITKKIEEVSTVLNLL